MCGAVCGAVGACLAGRIVANVETLRSPREDYPRCSVGWCAMQAGPELGGMEGGPSSVQFSSVQFSSVQFSSVQFSSEHPRRRRPACQRRRNRMHACMHALARDRLAVENGARPHASVHCSPQPSPVAAALPTLESPFVGLSHVPNDAQQLLLLLADQCEQRQQANPVAAHLLQTASAARMNSCEALHLQHPSC